MNYLGVFSHGLYTDYRRWKGSFRPGIIPACAIGISISVHTWCHMDFNMRFIMKPPGTDRAWIYAPLIFLPAPLIWELAKGNL